MFVLNADLHEAQQLEMDLRAFAGWRLLSHTELHAEHADDANSFEQPDVLTPGAVPATRMDGGVVTAVLPAASWNVFRFTKP